jgi:hypothetical protein
MPVFTACNHQEPDKSFPDDNILKQLSEIPIERERQFHSSEEIGQGEIHRHYMLMSLSYTTSQCGNLEKVADAFEVALLCHLQELFLSELGIRKVLPKNQELEEMAANTIIYLGYEIYDSDLLIQKLKERSKAHSLVFHDRIYESPEFRAFLSSVIPNVQYHGANLEKWWAKKSGGSDSNLPTGWRGIQTLRDRR